MLIACQSVKDGLTGKKQNNSDEFLIKKNPLILPPDYGKLPKPKDQEITSNENETNELEILLKKNQNLDEDTKIDITKETSVENFILDKIKNK